MKFFELIVYKSGTEINVVDKINVFWRGTK